MSAAGAHARGAAPDREFLLHQATQVVFGPGVVDRTGDYAATFGRRVLVVVGDSHARASGLLARVQGSLGVAGAHVELLEGVPTNPTTAVVDAGAMLARTWQADLVVALGGGSVVDVAKAVAMGAVDGRPSRELLSGIRTKLTDPPAGALPVVAVPTLPGAASETNGTSVLIDSETGRKLSVHDDAMAPRVALIDPLLALRAPQRLLAAGLVDGLCHAVEAGCSRRASIASDALAEQAVRLLVRHAPLALDVAAPDDDRIDAMSSCWWATNLAGQALALAGSTVTHPLAHALSAHVDAHHGEAVAALEGSVLARFGGRLGSRTVVIASWFDQKAKSPDDGLRAVLNRLARFCASCDVTRGIVDLGVDGDLVEQLVRDARRSGSRGLAAFPGAEPGPEELFEVLDLAISVTPTTPAKKLLGASAQIDSDALGMRSDLETVSTTPSTPSPHS